MPGGFAGSRHADARLLDEASDRVRRAVCSFMIPPGLDRGRLACFPYRRADARYSVVVFDISGMQVNRPVRTVIRA
jgi:hypothetical protein